MRPVDEHVEVGGLSLVRVAGRHGLGEVGEAMGPVSGFVLQMSGEPTVYVAGDTVWCSEVEETLERYQPDVTVLNAGTAQMESGGPITMTAADVCAVCRALPSTQVVAVHMEAGDLCTLPRSELRRDVARAGLTEQVFVPNDGEGLIL